MSAYKVDIHFYRLQAINFLQSLSLKFTPLAHLLNGVVMRQGYTVDTNDPTTWKYYLNLTGQYHPSDTMMVVNSFDTGLPINFTTENLSISPRTRQAYVPGTTYYQQLVDQYPTQSDLIKSIVYPVSDIDTAITAEDFTILAYSTEFLETTELDYILSYLQQTLDLIKRKRYPNYLSPIDESSGNPLINPYFYPIFYGQLWHRLLEAIFTARFLAIKTVNVHSWHIWEYLGSRGLQNYSDIMTREMQLFLYRNLNYLFWNRGKESTLKILNDNILEPLSIDIYARDVYQQTLTRASTYQLTPEFVAVPIYNTQEGVIDNIPSESVSDMNTQLVAIGDEYRTSQRWINQVTNKLSCTTLNKYPTKVLELDPQARDRKYADFFNNFVMDTLVTYISQGTYQPIVPIQGYQEDKNVFMNGKDILILLYYCLFREINQTPTQPPLYYKSSCAYWTTPKTPPERFVTFNMVGWIKNYLDIDSWMSDAQYSTLITLPDVFSQEMSEHFLKALKRVIQSRDTADLTMLKAMYTLVPSIFNTVNNTLNLTTIPTYEEWFNVNSDVYNNLIMPCEEAVDVSQAYSTLIQNIYTALVPCTEIMVNYGNFSLNENKYERLKELFISLCSYNVTFVGGNREVLKWFPICNDALASVKSVLTYNTPLFIDPPVTLEPSIESSFGLEVEKYSLTSQMDGTDSETLETHLEWEEKNNGTRKVTLSPLLNVSHSHFVFVDSVYEQDPITISVRS